MKHKAQSEDLVTKSFLRSELDDLKKEIDDRAQTYRDQILSKLDGTMGEFETMRQENIIGTHQISNLQQASDNHEKRIKHLEKTQPIV